MPSQFRAYNAQLIAGKEKRKREKKGEDSKTMSIRDLTIPDSSFSLSLSQNFIFHKFIQVIILVGHRKHVSLAVEWAAIHICENDSAIRHIEPFQLVFSFLALCMRVNISLLRMPYNMRTETLTRTFSFHDNGSSCSILMYLAPNYLFLLDLVN